MYGIIYMITNKVTGEMYVGQTTQPLKTRWYQHCNEKKSTKLSNTIKKYGKDRFYLDQIDSASSYSELNMKEVYWIEKLNTLSPNGYNIKSGGNCGRIFERSNLSNRPEKAAAAVKRFRDKLKEEPGKSLSGSIITIDYVSTEIKAEWRRQQKESGLSGAKFLRYLIDKYIKNDNLEKIEHC